MNQYTAYTNAALMQRASHPADGMSMSVSSADMFLETLREMQGTVAGKSEAAKILMQSFAERSIGRSVSGSSTSSQRAGAPTGRELVIIDVNDDSRVHAHKPNVRMVRPNASNPDRIPSSCTVPRLRTTVKQEDV